MSRKFYLKNDCVTVCVEAPDIESAIKQADDYIGKMVFEAKLKGQVVVVISNALSRGNPAVAIVSLERLAEATPFGGVEITHLHKYL